MKSEAKAERDFIKWVGAMDIIQFHAFCGTLWNTKTKKSEPWELWPGVRGYAGQREMLEAYSKAKFSWNLKARQLGGSEGAGLHGFKVAISEPKSEILMTPDCIWKL